MKKALKAIVILLLFYTIIALLLSCTTNDDDNFACDCSKQTYRIEQYVIMVNGLPRMSTRKTLIANERVTCQEDQQWFDGNLMYNIDCGE